MMFSSSAAWIFALEALTGWNPTGFRWNPGQLPIPYCITTNGQRTNVSAQGQRAAVIQGINAWRSTGVGGGMSCTTYDATPASYTCSVGVNLGDRRNNIFWETRWGNNGSSTLGVTHYVGTGGSCGVLNGPNGQQTLHCIGDADIELNDVTTTWSDDGGGATDIASIMAHEYGHFIGMGHCNENNTCRRGAAVMYASYSGGAVRVPFSDDINGGCSLYPGTPGGVGYPCTSGSQCTSGICVDPTTSGFCSQTCGMCPQGYKCGPNPQNPAQNVCVRDDGTNKAVCEVCSFGVQNACANRGGCITGIPEPQGGRCILPCPNPNAPDGGCATNFTCQRYTFGGGGSAYYCRPKSNDCTNLTNFRELDIGQQCNGDPPCRTGLDCIGICSQRCTTSPDNCPAGSGTACETFNFQSGAQNWCAPAVNEGQNCDGLKACLTGPCLLDDQNQATCYMECTGNPGACNNAQMCTSYTISGRPVGLCEPPGVPPLPPRPDAGPLPDTGMMMPDAGFLGPGPGSDGGMSAVPDTGIPSGPRPTDPTGGGNGLCLCDQYYFCESGCACDAECPCACDGTLACDLDNGEACKCDPECSLGSPFDMMLPEIQNPRGGCSGCQNRVVASSPSEPHASIAMLVMLTLAGLGVRRFIR